MEKASTSVGLDVHKETIDVTIAEAGAAGEVRHFGTLAGALEAGRAGTDSRENHQSRRDGPQE